MISVITIAYILWSSFSQPGPGGLKGDFKEIASVRNEQNTGPVVRAYAVALNDTLWGEMSTYGNYMPYTKYGTTTVYFFLNSKPVPSSLSLNQQDLSNAFKTACIGKYEKSVMGQVSLLKFPFHQ